MAVVIDKIIGGPLLHDHKVPQFENTDKPSPKAGDVWVKRTVALDGDVGVPRGLLLALTYSGDGVSTYELSYRTEEATTVRMTMS